MARLNTPTVNALEMDEALVDALLDKVAALLYAEVRPTLARRQRDRATTARAEAEAPNVTPLRRAG
ncbi:hypothetical protein [Terrabacter sp. BE26]|uniref:hypothetical protein n=1 Tax=Terrabacter sp. BE26 TaxID=2898152 RepID=UPI0035BE4B4D